MTKVLPKYASVLLAPLAFAGCSIYSVVPEPTVASTKIGTVTSGTPTGGTSPGTDNATPQASGMTVLDFAAATFAKRLTDSAMDAPSADKAKAAFGAGRALLDLTCNEYLDALGRANQRSSNERKQTGIVGGFASAIMGLTGSSATQIAGVGSAFSFSGASMDALATTYLFSDAATSITKLVRDAQNAYLGSAQDQIANLDYAHAVNLLIGYEQICRPAKIRSLIDQSINAATIVADDPGALPGNAAVSTLIGNLIGRLGVPVTESDASALYAWFMADAKGRATVEGNASFVADQVKAAGSGANLHQKVADLFIPLTLSNNPIAKRWAPAIAIWTAAAKPPPLAPVTTSVIQGVPSVRVQKMF